MEEKTQINDIDRSIYDIKDEEKDAYRIQAGLTPEIVEKISKENMIRHGWSCSVCNLFRSTMK
mgnify:CR=1 FL=1